MDLLTIGREQAYRGKIERGVKFDDKEAIESLPYDEEGSTEVLEKLKEENYIQIPKRGKNEFSGQLLTNIAED